MADAGSDSDDNKPVAALVARRLSSSSAQSSSTTVIGEASDSEDDLPIVQLIAKRQREGKLDEFMKKKKKAVNDSSKKREEDKNGSKTSNTSRPISRPGNTNASSSAEFYSSPKGQLVQNILSRWWYAIEWPRPEHIGKPPPGFETLDGFPGVFVSTSTDSLGNILDLRDKAECPCLSNYIKKPSLQLKSLCVTAITNQMQALIEAEGEDNARQLLHELKATLGDIKKIDPEKADKEAKKFQNLIGKSKNLTVAEKV